MSTIKISELATSNISLTDFFAKADATGLANKNTIQELSNVIKTEVSRNFIHNEPTLSDAVLSTDISIGDSINIKERTIGADNGGIWDVVLSSTVTENNYNIVQCTGIATLSLVHRVQTRTNTDESPRALMGGGGGGIAILGDSTLAGIGAGGTVYGEANADSVSGFSGDLKFASFQNISLFVPPNKEDTGYQSYNVNNTTGTRHPRVQMTVLGGSSFSKSFKKNSRPEVGNDFFVFFGTRTSDTAARAVVTIYDKDNIQVHQETIDSYTASIDFGTAGTVTQGLKTNQFKLTNALSTVSANDIFTLVVDSIDVIDRGSGVAADGSIWYYGSSQIECSQVYNFAVGSSTLKEGSSANISRGIETSTQLQKAYDLGCEVYYLGWGTNDSKSGVSTVDAFKNEYYDIILDIISNTVSPEIVLLTAPKGATGSVYENNVEYNEAIRQISKSMQVGLIDVEKYFAQRSTPNSGYYDDDIHPNELGYSATLGAVCSQMGISKNKVESPEITTTNITGTSRHEIPVSSDSTSSFIEVLNTTVTAQNRVRVSGVINLADANPLEAVKCRVVLTNNKTSATVTICEQIVNVPEVGTLAIGQIVFDDFYDFSSNPLTVDVSVQLQDYNIRSSSSTSVVIINAE
tara:strand:- start:313 stop:2214 length:1902 start_codon:yes stop_codon:yes gene_type:complete